MSVSVVVPVYNSEESLSTLVERLNGVLQAEHQLGEIILVNDGSQDRSWEAIQALAGRHPWILGINLMRNYGQHNALLCGIRAANHPVIVTIDDDLQSPPEEIPRLLAELEDGYDVIYGTPQKQAHGFLRNVASSITKVALQNALGSETARKVSAFRAFRTHLRDAFANYNGPYVSVDVLLTWGSKKFSAIPVRHDVRRVGVSHYTVGKLFAHGMNMLTGFSTLPLQIASLVGFVFTLFGLGILSLVLVRYFLGGTPVPGFPFLASVIAIFSGAQLFALGIIGEYLARMHFRLMDRPSYAVYGATRQLATGTESPQPTYVSQP